MLRNIVLLLALVAGGFALNWYFSATPPVASPAPVAAEAPAASYSPAPGFTFTDRAGKARTLAEFRGKVVLLNFWASWCVPCRTEFPQFIRLAQARPDKVVILALSVDREAAAMEKFLAGFPELKALPNFVIGLDEGKKISQDLYQTFRYPETILIGPEQGLRRKYVGIELAWDSPEFLSQIDDLR